MSHLKVTPPLDPRLRTVSARETRIATTVSFIAWTIAVYDFILFGTLLPRIQDAFGWDTSFALLVSTLVSIGTGIMVLAVGPLVDRFGRRKGMIISIGGTAASSAATAAVNGVGSLVAVRSISGVGLAESSINATYLNEIYAQSEDERVRRNKGFVYSFVQAGWPVGALVAAAFVAGVQAIWGPDSWRIAFLLATIPAVLTALLCRRLRESPQYEDMRRARQETRERTGEQTTQLPQPTGLAPSARSPFARIFQRRHIRNTLFLSLAWIFNYFGLQVFSVLGTTVLETGKGLDASTTLILVIASNVVGAAGYLFFGWIGDRWGRRRVIAAGWSASGVAFAVLMLGPSNPVFVLIAYMAGLFLMLGPYAALMFFQTECFDADCRGTGSAFAYSMSQPGAIIGGLLLTGLTALALPLTITTVLVGAGGLLLSGALVLGAQPLTQSSPEGGDSIAGTGTPNPENSEPVTEKVH
ncbi:MFS transporter [Nocardia grenadensis]|uniref:MFS transporter n=1 Tax=Nocardia grenadensis TaxID=931537 RepID=UPI000A054590|nr:MFS transporter [Nocardia grenadensis]